MLVVCNATDECKTNCPCQEHQTPHEYSARNCYMCAHGEKITGKDAHKLKCVPAMLSLIKTLED